MRLSTTGLLVTFALGLFWTPLVATAQQPVKLIGVLLLGVAPSEAQQPFSPPHGSSEGFPKMEESDDYASA